MNPLSLISSRFISPISRLPYEILFTIFAHARSITPTSRESPLFAIMHVSFRWRHVVLTSPTLFAIIDYPTTAFQNPQSEALRRFFSLSAGLPVTFRLEERDTMVFDYRGDTRLLLENSSRWRDVRFVVPAVEIVTGLTDKKYAFPILEKLHIDSSYAPPSQWALQLFLDAPRLKDVMITRAERPTLYHLPWTRLTAFANASPHLDEHLEVLRMATALVRYEALGNLDGTTSTTVLHGNLRHLIVRNLSLLRSLELPALETLECDFVDAQDLDYLKNSSMPKILIRPPCQKCIKSDSWITEQTRRYLGCLEAWEKR